MVDSLPDNFWREIKGRFDRLPVWLPGTSIALGDVGEFGRGGWTKVTSLSALGVTYNSDMSGAPTDIEYSSQSGVQIATYAATEVKNVLPGIAEGHGAMKVSFSRNQAFIFNSYGVQTSRISNLDEVDNSILNLVRSSASWRPSWIVAFEVSTANSTIFLLAGEAGAEAVVDLGAEVSAGLPVPAQAKVGLNARTHHGMAAMFVTASPASVMWRGRYVHRGISGTKIKERGEEAVARDQKIIGIEIPVVEELESPDEAPA